MRVAARRSDVGDPSAMGVAPVAYDDAIGRSLEAGEAFASAGIRYVDLRDAEGGQVDTQMHAPIRAYAAGLGNHAGVDDLY